MARRALPLGAFFDFEGFCADDFWDFSFWDDDFERDLSGTVTRVGVHALSGTAPLERTRKNKLPPDVNGKRGSFVPVTAFQFRDYSTFSAKINVLRPRGGRHAAFREGKIRTRG